MKIQVLMSSYNGEKYIREQLDSILAQKLSTADLEITVRDDGSSDDTLNILEEYNKKYGVNFLKEKNVGVINSFFELIKNASDEADYIALSDQDDVWFEDKLETAVSKLEKCGQDKPRIYCSMPQATDEQLNPIPYIMLTNEVKPDFGNALVENIATGCTIVANKEMIKLLQKATPDYTPMHDWWIYLLAACYGEVIYDQSHHMYYRQHGDNTVGVKKSYFSEFVARLKRYKGNRGNISDHILSLVKFAEETDMNISDEKMELIRLVLESKKSMKKRIRLMRNKRVYRQRKNDDRIFRIIMLLGSM